MKKLAKKPVDQVALLALLDPLQCEFPPNSDTLSLVTIRTLLAQRIQNLLLEDFQGLLNALYRIDVREAQFHHVMENSPANEIAKEIANLVISRQLEKIETRKKYR